MRSSRGDGLHAESQEQAESEQINSGVLHPMLRGYRSIVCAGVGLALVGAKPAPQPEAVRQRSDVTTQTGEAPTPILASPKAITRVQAAKEQAPCGPYRYGSNDDLCAQWKAADSAQEAARWARWSFWLGIVGTFGLIATLYYTRKAVLAAEEATDDANMALAIAERNATAAARQADLMVRLNRIQTEPRIEYTRITLRYIKNDIQNANADQTQAFVNIKNWGATTATDVFCAYGFKIKRLNGDIIWELPLAAVGDNGILLPSQESAYPPRFIDAGIEPALDDLEEGNSRAESEIVLSYKTEFGDSISIHLFGEAASSGRQYAQQGSYFHVTDLTPDPSRTRVTRTPIAT